VAGQAGDARALGESEERHQARGTGYRGDTR
jgi:hypothetical protein